MRSNVDVPNPGATGELTLTLELSLA